MNNRLNRRVVKKKLVKDEGTQPMSAMSMPSNLSLTTNIGNNQIRVRIDKVMEATELIVEKEGEQKNDRKTMVNYPVV